MTDAAAIATAANNGGHVLSDASAAWLGSCLNPFSDYTQSLVGYPDMNTQPSVVMMYSSQLDITTPGGTTNWDCAIYNTPVDTTATAGAVNLMPRATSTPYVHNIYGYDHATASTMSIFPLTVCTGVSGSDVSLTSTTATRSGLYSRNVTGTPGRVIAKGFEVNNTTAEIYRQGSVTVGLIPPCPDEPNVVTLVDTNATPAVTVSLLAKQVGTFPSSLATLRAIPQTAQWEAAKGVYMVPRMSAHPAVNFEDLDTVYYRDEAGLDYTTHPYGVVSGVATYPVLTRCNVDAFCGAEAYFTGLSPQTVLTVTFRTIVEYFPLPGSNLITEARSSAAYDSYVLEVYNTTAKTAPFAVPVGQNAAGDFFRKVLGAVKTAAPLVAKLAAPFPIVSRAATVVGKVANRAQAVMERPVVQQLPQVFSSFAAARAAGNGPAPSRKKRQTKKRKRPQRQYLSRDAASYARYPMRY